MIYLIFSEIRNFLYDKNFLSVNKLPGKTISVGNIELGGTGKTPTVIEVCKILIEAHQRPAILTRGYKSGLKRNESAILQNKVYIKSPRTLHADEAMECSHSLPSVPIILGAKRFAAACLFLSMKTGYQPTHWILDDGFQHRKLHRDLDLLLLTPRFSLSPWAVLPFARQREWGRNIKRASVVLLSKFRSFKGDTIFFTEKLSRYQANVFFLEHKFEKFLQVSGEITELEKAPSIRVVTGIATPGIFLQMLQELKLSFQNKSLFSDHKKIPWEKFLNNDEVIVTTAKDYYRETPPKELKIFIAASSVVLDENLVKMIKTL